MKKSLFLSAMVFLLAAGCGNTQQTQTTPEGTPTQQTGELDTQTGTEVAANEQVELIDPGSEPRQQLRFNPQENTTQTIEITVTQEVSQAIEGQAQPGPSVPTIQMVIDSEVVGVNQNGDIRLNVTYRDLQVVGEQSEEFQAELQQLVGTTGELVVSDRGNIQDSSWNFPEGVETNNPQVAQQVFQQLASSLENEMTRLPAEPVGIGARWQIPTAVATSDMNISQVTTYELVELQGQVATLEVQQQQQAPRQQINDAQLPPGASIELTSLEGQGSGTTQLNLNRVLPTSANTSNQTTTNLAVQAPNTEQTQTLAQTVQTQTRLESR